MEFKGTKGEWKYEGGDEHSIDIVLDDESTITIDRQSRYTGEYNLSREGMESNAKLIAAAPELLNALLEVRSFINAYKDKNYLARLLSYEVDIQKAIEKALK